MTTLEHKKYGSMGSEFIVHHSIVQPRRLITGLVLTTALSLVFKVYEMCQGGACFKSSKYSSVVLDVVVLWTMSLLLAVVLVFRLVYKVSKEVLLVFPGLGVQVKTQYWLGGLETRFFDKSCVKGIVINEAITMQSVLCYLAVLLTSTPSGPVEQILPVFTRSWPGLKDLVYVYQSVQSMCCDHPKDSLDSHRKQGDATAHRSLRPSCTQHTVRQLSEGETTGPRTSPTVQQQAKAMSGRKRRTRLVRS